MNTRRLATVAVSVALALPCAIGRTADDPIVLRLAPYAGGPLRTLSAEVNGKPATFLFDTGGGMTVLSATLARQLGCPVFGRGTGFRHDGTRVDGPRGGPIDFVAGGYRRRAEVGVLDLDALLQGLPKVGGIACLETFAGRALTVDLANNQLVLETAASLATCSRGAAELQVRIGSQAGGAGLDLFVAIEGKHGPLWFELDCGNTQSVLIAPHAFAELGLEPVAAGKTARMDLPIVGLGKVACEIASRELIYDGLLNATFFMDHSVTMDLSRGRAWARKATAK